MGTALILMAAGASRRFGAADKLLAMLNGRPLVTHAATAALAVAVDHRVAVVSDPAVASLLAGFDIVTVAQGGPQSDSLRAAVARAAALGADGALVILGDMPHVSSRLMQAVLARGASGAAAASDGSHILPPAYLPQSLFADVAGLTGDRGAGALLKDLPQAQRVLALPAELLDIDLPGDLIRAAPPPPLQGPAQ